MKINRKRNAISGTLTGILKNIIQVFFPVALRAIFIQTIGIEYLGLNSLFTSILQVLNLAELGVSSALIYSMYKPIADDDVEKICQLMNLYRFYYRIIGLIILGIGLALVPLIPILVKNDIPRDVNIYVLYLINLGATVISYWLFAHYNSLFEAHQRNDIINLITVTVSIIMYGLQIVALVFFRSYYFYLIVRVGCQIITCITEYIVARKHYPQYKPFGKVSERERKGINHIVKDVFITKIGGVVNNSVDSIVISAFLGLQLLAIYQNYYYVVAALMAVFQIFFSACSAGVGNSLIIQKEDQNIKLLYNINYTVFVAINYCCVCLVCLYQPFIELWVGKEYVLPFPYVILFAAYIYAEEAPRTLVMFKDAGGIWRQDRFRPLTAATVNLIFNLVLTPRIGLYGIIISTIVALLFIAFPWVIYNINKCMFRIDIRRYLIRLVQFTFVIVIDTIITYSICSLTTFKSLWLTIITRLIMCTVAGNGLFVICFCRTEENRYLMEIIRGFFNKVRFKPVH